MENNPYKVSDESSAFLYHFPFTTDYTNTVMPKNAPRLKS